MGGQKTLFIAGFGKNIKAKDLAEQFERFGPVDRVDIPFPKFHQNSLYAFVEFEKHEDAKEAYSKMHKTVLEGDDLGGELNVQWAKENSSGKDRRGDRRRSRSPRRDRRRSRSRSRRRSRSPRRRSRSPRRRSPSPRRSRSPKTPERRESRRDSPDRGRSPTPKKLVADSP